MATTNSSKIKAEVKVSKKKSRVYVYPSVLLACPWKKLVS